MRLNEINSIENLVIGNDLFAKNYTFYDEDVEMSNTLTYSREST